MRLHPTIRGLGDAPARIWAVLGAGVLLSLLSCAVLRAWETRDRNFRVLELAREQVGHLRANTLRSMEVLHSIRSLHAANGRPRADEFRLFVQSALVRQPELQALSWNPSVADTNRADFEASARHEGQVGFEIRQRSADNSLVRADSRDHYVPVQLIEPLRGNAAALGFDLYSDPRRRATLEKARDSGQAVASAPLTLAQGPDGAIGFLVVLPVYRGGGLPEDPTQRRARLDGFAVAVFRVNDLVSAALDGLRRRGIESGLFDESDALESIHGQATVPVHAAAIDLDVAGRRWVMRFWPTAALAPARLQSTIVLVGGLVLALLTAAYLQSGWRRTVEVSAANRELQEEVVVRKRAEASAASANQAKSDFLASMSHEIRTPLNAILGYTQLMQRDASLAPEQRDSVNGIRVSGQHLLGLINEILDLSKIEAGRMEVRRSDFDLRGLADGLSATFRPLAAQKRISFRLVVDGPSAVRVRGDEGKLRQILINLLGNAVKFTEDGEVFVRFQMRSALEWTFEVIDSGPGIPREEQVNLFQPFHQGSAARWQGGTGLGLAIAQRQVLLLGGRLEFQSEPGVGSRFYFSLAFEAPLAREPMADGEILRLSTGQSLKVLVVDDQADNRHVLGGMLSGVGCQVQSAAQAGEALVRFREFRPDVVLLDLLLPGTSGAETARQILAEPGAERCRIIAHTASALPELRGEALGAGCVEVLAKPILCEFLCASLERHTGRRFERGIRDQEEHAPSQEALRPVTLPEPLWSRLFMAADLHSTTALKSCLQEVRQLGPEAQPLADAIRQLMRSYDMEGIQRLLSSCAPAPSPAPAPV